MNWLPWEPPANAVPQASAYAVSGDDRSPQAGDIIKLTPMTTLVNAATAGASTLDLVPLDELWADELAGRLGAWFSEGDVVVFDP